MNVSISGSMSGVKFFVWASERWCEVEAGNGRVSGWRERARFVYVRRGRLQLARRSAVLRGLRALAAGHPLAVRTGPRLSEKRCREVVHKQRASPCRCCRRHCRSRSRRPLTAHAHKDIPHVAESTPCTEHRPAKRKHFLSSDDITEPPQGNSKLITLHHSIPRHSEHSPSSKKPKQMYQHSRSSQEPFNCVKGRRNGQISENTVTKQGFNNEDLRSQSSNDGHDHAAQRSKKRTNNIKKFGKRNGKSRRKIIELDSATSDDAFESNLRSRKAEGSRTHKSTVKAVGEKSTLNMDEDVGLSQLIRSSLQPQGAGEACKELLVDAEDVEALRGWLLLHSSSETLLRFDQDDDYKRRIFYAINPLVSLERCPKIARLLRDSTDASLQCFMSSLGLRSVAPPSQPRRTRSSLRGKQRTRSSEADKENKMLAAPDTTKQHTKRIKRSDDADMVKSKENHCHGNSTHGGNKGVGDSGTKARETEDTPSHQLRHRNIERASNGKERDDTNDTPSEKSNLRLKNMVERMKYITRKVASINETILSNKSEIRLRNKTERDRNTKKKKRDSSDTSSDGGQRTKQIEPTRRAGINKRNSILSSDKHRTRPTRALERHNNTQGKDDERDTSNDSDSGKRKLKQTIALENTKRKETPESKVTSTDKFRGETNWARNTKQKETDNSSDTSSDRSRRLYIVESDTDTTQNINDGKSNKPELEQRSVTETENVKAARGKGTNLNNNIPPHKVVKSKSTVARDRNIKVKETARGEDALYLNSDSEGDTHGRVQQVQQIQQTVKAATSVKGDFNPTISKRPTREYSSLEDHAIVSWLSSGARARQVKGNRVWRLLQEAYPSLTGQERTWQSLRNRYLRYVLPALGALALRPQHAQRLRAAASAGTTRRGLEVARRASIFKADKPLGASSRRYRLPPSPSPPPAPALPPSPSHSSSPSHSPCRSHSPSPSASPSRSHSPSPSHSPSRSHSSSTSTSPDRDRHTRAQDNQKGSSSARAPRRGSPRRGSLRRGSPPRVPQRRSLRYSDVTRQFAATHAALEQLSSPTVRRSPRQPGSAPVTSREPPGPRTRKLYNPNAIV